jgi:hypothetical protein
MSGFCLTDFLKEKASHRIAVAGIFHVIQIIENHQERAV